MTATTGRRRKPARRVLELITTVPWAITAEALQTIIAVASREGLDPEAIATKIYGRIPEPETLAAKAGSVLEGTFAATLRDGVATIPVIGPMFRYADLFTQISGGTTYDALANDFTAALESPEVGAILLDVDSPGGEANGVGELSRMIYEARLVEPGRSAKPVVAYIGGMGASAAYWLAAAAGEVVVHETAIIGSIGVRMELLETWMRDASKGLRTISLVSTQSPRKAMEASDLQALIDQIAEQFVADVALYRGVSADQVLSEFGAGGVFVGQAAIDAGLADRLGTYESVHAELVGQIADASNLMSLIPQGRAQGARVSASAEETPMKTDKPGGQPAAGAEARPAAASTQEQPLTATQVAEQHPDAAKALRVEGATAERERILAIESLSIAGHEDVIEAAKKDPAATPEGTAVKLLQAQKAKATLEPAKPGESGRDAGKTHLANLAGDEAQSGAPRVTHSAAGATTAEQTVQELVSFATLRPQGAATPSR